MKEVLCTLTPARHQEQGSLKRDMSFYVRGSEDDRQGDSALDSSAYSTGLPSECPLHVCAHWGLLGNLTWEWLKESWERTKLENSCLWFPKLTAKQVYLISQIEARTQKWISISTGHCLPSFWVLEAERRTLWIVNILNHWTPTDFWWGCQDKIVVGVDFFPKELW